MVCADLEILPNNYGRQVSIACKMAIISLL